MSTTGDQTKRRGRPPGGGRAKPREGATLDLERQIAGRLAGVDEAGRGPWAGPVCAAAVILDPDRAPKGLDDSKKLTERARLSLAEEIRATALAWSVAYASVSEISDLNILQATGLAMRRAVAGLAVRPDFILIDGNRVFELGAPARAVVGGDGVSASIAAASILAKTDRDALMDELDRLYPGYGFSQHKGYGVPVHAEALIRLGPTPEHRMSFTALQRRLAEGRGT